MKNKKLLFDKRRHSDKVSDKAFVIEAPLSEVKTLIDKLDVKIHGFDGYIETDATALDEQVLHSEGFEIAESHNVTFRNYAGWRLNISKTKVMLKFGFESRVRFGIATDDQFKAYLGKFGGKDNLYFEPSEKHDEYYIKSIAELESMAWNSLKNYLKDYSIDARYNLNSEQETRDALYIDIQNGFYNEER